MKKIVLSVVAALAASRCARIRGGHAGEGRADGAGRGAVPVRCRLRRRIMTDYMWRGITQSAHKPSVAAYFEPRYNINPNLQLYAGLVGREHQVPERRRGRNRLLRRRPPDLRSGRLRRRRLVLLLSGWRTARYTEWWTGSSGDSRPPLPTPASSKSTARRTWTVNDIIAVGGNFYYTPSYLEHGRRRHLLCRAPLKLTAPSTMTARRHRRLRVGRSSAVSGWARPT